MRIISGKREHHSYICRFCKKVLRCAQALGGHMNIHRRDRAKAINEESVVVHSQSQSKSILPTYMEPQQYQSIIRHTKDDFTLLDGDEESCVETSLSASIPSKRQKSSTIVCYNFMEDIDLELRLGDTSAIH